LANELPPSARLIIVPHGILNYVPFEALMPKPDHFLVEDYAISYAPSASSLAFLRARQATGHAVVAVGNPVMQNPGSADQRGANLARVSALKPLVHSGPEVRAVAGVYGSTARVFEQQAAVEAVLTGEEASRAGIIHIATHGLIDAELPDRSGLALTAAGGSDGILQMREVYRLRLSAALVTLSACQTALGKEITGEGMVGLSRAFFYAGSNAVLASLWNVNDASTEQLMRPFYERLAGGAPIDGALRQAKLELLQDGGRFSHPYYWAAFVATGNATAPVPVRAERSWASWTVIAAILVILVAGGVAWRRVRS
jgi:CHAT domain-containing protein